MKKECAFLKTPLGVLKIEMEGVHVVAIEKARAYKKTKKSKAMKNALQELENYFYKSKKRKLKISFKLRGTEFQRKVWKTISQIPFGHVLSYSEVACKVKSPKASRAVGQACHKNPCLILIPCHRVVGASGSLVGFALGMRSKKWLLFHENVI